MSPTDQEIIQAFGQALKEKRKELGITQAALAKKAKIRRKDVSQYENGVKGPRLITVLKLVNAFGSSAWLRRMDEILTSRE